MSNRTWKIEGPRGYYLTVDLDEVYPDDPGAGAPFLIETDAGASGTFWAARNEGEIEGAKLPEKVQDWVSSGVEQIVCECESAIHSPDEARRTIGHSVLTRNFVPYSPDHTSVLYVVIWGGKPFCSFDSDGLVDAVLAFFKTP